MFKLALVALLCAQAFARPQEAEIEPYVIGGKKAKEGEFPFAVSLRPPESNDSFCGGALLSDRYVLTAAHCVHELEPPRVGAGSVNLKSQKIYDVEKIIVHPKFDFPGDDKNNIALLKLKTPVKLGGNIQTINFPVTEDLVGKNCTGLGWGRTEPDFDAPNSQDLYYLTAPVISNKECSNRTEVEIRDGEICLLGGVDREMQCGDSGSPLIYKAADGKKYVAGIMSWGWPCGNGHPDVFSRVSFYADWIKKNMV